MRMLTLSTLLCGALLAPPALGQGASQEPDAPGAPILRPVPGTEAGPDGRRTADTILWHAEDLLGTSILNLRDENLGTVEDVVINPHQGVIHVLVDTGGILGVGEERVAIGLSEMTVRDDGTLILDSSPSELASREQYRFPESPTTGSVMPGPPVPQTAAGIGQPSQGPQFVPGASGQSEVREQREAIPSDRVRDTPLGQILRGEVGGPTGTDDSGAGYANRDTFLQAAERRVQEFEQSIRARALPAETKEDLARQHQQAADRLDSLRQASEEAWPTALKNFRVSLARLQENWQQAEATGGAQDTGPPRQD